MKRTLKLTIPGKNEKAVDQPSVNFVAPEDWADVFVQAIRYKAIVYVNSSASNSALNTRIAAYVVPAPEVPLHTEAHSCAVYADPDDPANRDFLAEIKNSATGDFEFRIHLPTDLIRFRAKVLRLEKSKFHFTLVSAPFRQFTRRYARVGIQIPVLFTLFRSTEDSKDLWMRAEGIDLSEGGLGFIIRENAFKNLPAIGTEVEQVCFKLGGVFFNLRTIIRHVNLMKQNQFPQKRYRVGVEFSAVDKNVLEKIRAFVEKELTKP
jgi:hypothetical protein